MTFAAVGSGFGTSGSSSLSLTTSTIGDFILAEVLNHSGTAAPTGLSSSNVTWSTLGTPYTATVASGVIQCFIGTVTAASTATLTVTLGSGTTGTLDWCGQEFSSTAGIPVLDVQGHVDTLSSNTSWASLTPAAAGELYWGYCQNAANAAAGSTSGYVYNANIDTADNGMAYNLSCGATATFPVWGDVTQSLGMMVLVKAPAAATVPIAAARRTASRTPALPPVRRYRSMLPVPAQLNPPYPHRELVQRRQEWPRGMPRRSHVSIVVPKQLNPPYPVSEIRQWRQPRGFFTRRGHQFMPTPPQQAAAPNPAFTFQQPKHLRMVYLRRGRQVMPVPAQQAPPAGVFVPQAQRHARIVVAPRRGKITGAHLTQAEAPPRQRQPVRPRPFLPRRHHLVEVVPAQVVVAAPAWVQGHRSPLRAIFQRRRRFGQLMPWPQAVAPAFSVGTLTAADEVLATLSAADMAAGTITTAVAAFGTLTAAEGTLATLTAADKRTGGPS